MEFNLNDTPNRAGSTVEIKICYDKGLGSELDEKGVLERATEVIARRLGELGADE